jgi:hypothetical protein
LGAGAGGPCGPVCVTAKGTPATSICPVRCEPAFCAIVTATLAGPRPDPGATLIHDTSLRADHSQAACVRI